MERDLSAENEARKKDNFDLRALLDREKENLFADFSRGTSQVRDQVEKDKGELKAKLEAQRRELEADSKRLAQQMGKEGEQLALLSDTVSLLTVSTTCLQIFLFHPHFLQKAAQQPGQYFCAVREEPYCTGGEEYLTFHHCR